MQRIGFIFLHGFAGRAETRVLGLTFEYFRGLRRVAQDIGIETEVPQMPGRSGIEARAETVREIMAAMSQPTVVLVGVSMGGLVARALAARHDPDRRVRVVATVCTPHRGSPLADRALSGESRMPDVAVRLFEDAVRDLGGEAAAAFNAQTPDREDVRYLSWAGRGP